MPSSSPDAAIDDMIATMKRLSDPGLVRKIAIEAAPGVEAALRATAKAGGTPAGAKWQATKDGAAPLQHAADHITVKASGTSVLATLKGPDAFHNFGVRGVQRQVIPAKGDPVPAGVNDAIKAAASRVFDREMAGGS